MTSVAVAKLKLSCEAQHRDRLRHAIEDGLRTNLPDERRLVLLRRMRIAGTLASPAQREEAVRAGWLAAVAGARHGGADGAADANCVWFESSEEAEALLLAWLLAGRATHAWYWKLAVPDWRGLPVRGWLSRCIAEALVQGDDRRLLAIASTCLAAGASERLVEAIGVSPIERPGAASARPGPSPPAEAPMHGGQALPGDADPEAAALAPLPPQLHRMTASLVRGGGGAPAAAAAILRAWALRRSPALALSPSRLAATMAATLGRIRAPARAEPAPVGPADRPAPPASRKPSAAVGAPAAQAPDASSAEAAPAARPHDPAPVAEPEPEPAPDVVDPRLAEASAPRRFRHSDHAGLWLVVPSLVQLGFREWLMARPSLLGDHPAALLLHAIARHHRIAADDPALAVLPPAQDWPLPAWTGLWRHGLDRWLRRTVRLRLHDLVNRPGALDWDEWRVDIRYPAEAVDIVLRRRALDRDPGWTDWLGLSVRYHFGGETDWL